MGGGGGGADAATTNTAAIQKLTLHVAESILSNTGVPFTILILFGLKLSQLVLGHNV